MPALPPDPTLAPALPDALSISVIIPCFNVGRWVAECLDSVYAQSFLPVEIICVDDGSTDGTGDVLAKYHRRDSSSLTVIRTPNRGAAAARNTGLARASGAWIQFLDGDDLILPQKLQHQATMIRAAETEPDLLAADYVIQGPSGAGVRMRVSRDGFWAGLMQSRLGITSSNLWRRTSLLAVGGWNEDLASSQEYDLMFRLLKAGAQVLTDDTPNTVVRPRPSGSISSSNLGANLVRLIHVRQAALDQIRLIHGADSAVHAIALQAIFRSLRALHHYDARRARMLHRSLLPRSFVPEVSSATRWSYVACYRAFGFEIAQRLASIRHGLRRIRRI